MTSEQFSDAFVLAYVAGCSTHEYFVIGPGRVRSEWPSGSAVTQCDRGRGRDNCQVERQELEIRDAKPCG